MTEKFSRSRRIRKAYWTTFRVLTSYVKLHLLTKVFGQSYYERKVISTHLRNAKRVKKTILELKGLFIKIGQLLSILTNYLPEAFHEPLEGLQDQVPARPYAEIASRIVSEFGKKPEELFKSFNEIPIASASIGQVHRASLADGTEVVVKVQHADIEKIAKVDLEIMRRLVKLCQWFFNIKGIEHAYVQVRAMIEEELDFTQEANSMQRIQENLIDEANFVIPDVHEAYSTSRVLTTTFYEGVKISNTEQLDAWQVDRRALADRLVAVYCKMVFEHGIYHADPHPGNILIQQDGTMVLLDFGAVASLREEMRSGFLRLIEAAVKNDREKIVISLKDLGFIANEKEAGKIAEKVIDAFRNFLQHEVKFDGLNLTDIKVNPFDSSLYNLTSEIGLKELLSVVQVPKDYVLLNRMVTLLLGICSTLDPQMNPLDTIRPYFQKFVLGEKGSLTEWLSNFLRKNISAILTLPMEFSQTLKKLNRGEVELKIEGSSRNNKLKFALAQQFFFLILGVFFILLPLLFPMTFSSFWQNVTVGLGVGFLLNTLRWMRKAKRISNQG